MVLDTKTGGFKNLADIRNKVPSDSTMKFKTILFTEKSDKAYKQRK